MHFNDKDAADSAQQFYLTFEICTDEMITIFKAQGLTERTVKVMSHGWRHVHMNAAFCCRCRHFLVENRYYQELLWTDGMILTI